MNEAIVEDITKIKGVKGAALVRSTGDVAVSSIDESGLNDFLGFLFGVAPTLQNAAKLGNVNGLVLKTTDDEYLSVFIEGDEALGVIFTHEIPPRQLRLDIDELLLWG